MPDLIKTNQQGGQPTCCPFCQSEDLVLVEESAFVEIGEYVEDRYEREGDLDSYRCEDCNNDFFTWSD